MLPLGVEQVRTGPSPPVPARQTAPVAPPTGAVACLATVVIHMPLARSHIIHRSHENRRCQRRIKPRCEGDDATPPSRA